MPRYGIVKLSCGTGEDFDAAKFCWQDCPKKLNRQSCVDCELYFIEPSEASCNCDLYFAAEYTSQIPMRQLLVQADTWSMLACPALGMFLSGVLKREPTLGLDLRL